MVGCFFLWLKNLWLKPEDIAITVLERIATVQILLSNNSLYFGKIAG